MDYLAQVDFGPIFFKGLGTAYQTPAGVSSIVTLITRSIIILASVSLLFFFVLGGIGMMTSAGKNDPQAAAQAKKTVTSALIGFVVVFMAYWIVKLIGELLKFPNLI